MRKYVYPVDSGMTVNFQRNMISLTCQAQQVWERSLWRVPAVKEQKQFHQGNCLYLSQRDKNMRGFSRYRSAESQAADSP
jgi:hypothetical protein